MAKSFVRSLIDRTIGRFVETDVAALNVAFWKGRIDLKDLPLRKDLIDSLGLPLFLEDGIISNIQMSVPWRHLSTKPVRVSVSGVRLRCGLRAAWDDPAELLRIEVRLYVCVPLYPSAPTTCLLFRQRPTFHPLSHLRQLSKNHSAPSSQVTPLPCRRVDTCYLRIKKN